ncbi:MAG: hypothetical protein ACXW2T_07075 [Allosphingosinicella sp.]
MRNALLVLVAAAGLSACASVGQAPLVEQGYARGSLGVAAIERQDWAAAERQMLQTSNVQANDPARLINLGHVYMETGRTSDALSVWRRALASESEFPVETVTGEIVSTRELARRALAFYDMDIRVASVD